MTKGTSILERTVDKLEKTIKEELSDENLDRALESLNNYRRKKGYIIFEEAPNKPEIELINSLKDIFQRTEGRELTLSELGSIFGTRKVFSDAWRRRVKFKRKSINQFEHKIKELLSDDLLDEALNALELYREKRGITKISDLLDEPNYEDYVPELELILLFRDNFTEQFNNFYPLGKLGKLLFENRVYFYQAIAKKSSFRDITLRKLRAGINRHLTGAVRKEILRILNYYEALDKLRTREIELGSDRWKNPD